MSHGLKNLTIQGKNAIGQHDIQNKESSELLINGTGT